MAETSELMSNESKSKSVVVEAVLFLFSSVDVVVVVSSPSLVADGVADTATPVAGDGS